MSYTTYTRKAWTVIGYTADADYHCPECAALIYDRTIDGVLRTVADERQAFTALDFEGNAVHPIFASDELDAGTTCGRCGERLSDDDELCVEHGQHARCIACSQCDFECDCTTTEREESAALA